MIKAVLADDQSLILDSLEIMLSNVEDIEIIGKATDGQEALDLILEEEPEVALLDIRMPRLTGLEVLAEIRKRKLDTRILLLTTFDDDSYIRQAIAYKAAGYLLKSVSSKELSDAVIGVGSGGTYITPEIASKMVNMVSYVLQNAFEQEDIKNSITEREWEILKGISQGLSNKEIAYSLNISDGTVRNYISNIIKKTGLRDRTQIAIYAIQSGNLDGC